MESELRKPAFDMLAERAVTWPEAASPVARLFVNLLRCADLVQTRSASRVVAKGMTFAEFEALAALRSTPPPHEAKPEEIRRSLLLTSGGLSKVLAALGGRGLVERPAGLRDRREKPVRLTEHGRTLIESAMTDVLAADATLIAETLTDDERERLTGLIARLLARVERNAPAGKD